MAVATWSWGSGSPGRVTQSKNENRPGELSSSPAFFLGVLKRLDRSLPTSCWPALQHREQAVYRPCKRWPQDHSLPVICPMTSLYVLRANLMGELDAAPRSPEQLRRSAARNAASAGDGRRASQVTSLRLELCSHFSCTHSRDGDSVHLRAAHNNLRARRLLDIRQASSAGNHSKVRFGKYRLGNSCCTLIAPRFCLSV